MFAIQLMTAGLLMCCPPTETREGVRPDAAQDGQAITAEAPAAPVQMKRRVLRPGKIARLASFDDGVGGANGDGDEDSDAFIASAKSAGAIPAGGPWLGLQFGPPAKPMRVQLGIEEGQGQVVLNMVEGSPADAAGLAQYDVITAIDGRPVPSELDKFIDMIKGFVPGETRGLTYIRGGKQAQASLAIGSRPEDIDASKYKYAAEEEAEALSQNQVSNFGRIIEKDKDGNWVMRDLGKLENLPDDVWKLLPQGGGSFNFTAPGDARENIVIQQTINGATVKVERKDGGEIIVSRTTEENGNTNTSVKTYANDPELQTADPEAHKMLSGSKRDLGQLGRDQMMFRNRFKFAPMDMGHLRKQHEDMGKMYQQQAEEMRKQAESYRSMGKQGATTLIARQPKTSFELQTDGSVRATVRQGDQELVEQFKNVDEMKNNRPELYKKYQKLQSRPAGKQD